MKDRRANHWGSETTKTYQYCGKLSLSSCHQRSSSLSRSLSRWLLPDFWTAFDVLRRVMVTVLELLCFEE